MKKVPGESPRNKPAEPRQASPGRPAWPEFHLSGKKSPRGKKVAETSRQPRPSLFFQKKRPRGKKSKKQASRAQAGQLRQPSLAIMPFCMNKNSRGKSQKQASRAQAGQPRQSSLFFQQKSAWRKSLRNTPAEPTKKEYAPLPSACTRCQPLCFLSVSWGASCCAVHATSATHRERPACHHPLLCWCWCWCGRRARCSVAAGVQG